MNAMKLKSLLSAALLSAGAVVLVAASKPLPPADAVGTNWNTTVTRTDRDSYVLGNPKAPLKLVEFISYTCPHCAHFEEQADAPLRIGMVAQGKGSVEVRPFIRNQVDLAVALLAECGDPSKFFMNHAMFLHRQDDWISPMMNASPAQVARWSTGELTTRMRHIADDFGLYDMMRDRGYERAEVDKCLADTALAKRLEDETEAYSNDPGVNGTPSFMLDGILLAGTYDWDSLRPQIDARLDEMGPTAPVGS